MVVLKNSQHQDHEIASHQEEHSIVERIDIWLVIFEDLHLVYLALQALLIVLLLLLLIVKI